MRRTAAALLLPLIAALALVGCGSSSPPPSPNTLVSATGSFGTSNAEFIR